MEEIINLRLITKKKEFKRDCVGEKFKKSSKSFMEESKPKTNIKDLKFTIEESNEGENISDYPKKISFLINNNDNNNNSLVSHSLSPSIYKL